ncbi:MAG TPA: SPOR domain-containing protein [Holophaga sp.]|nr:SPOR domain-containing protein [Holophaga sp.]
MPERDPQSIVLSRPSILLVTAVGVGLLTLCYVLGVQVGKQSAALRNTAVRGSGEDLQELPASIDEQLKALQATEMVKPEKVVPAGGTAKPAEAGSTPAVPQEIPKPEPAKAEPAGPEPAKVEAAKPEPAKPEVKPKPEPAKPKAAVPAVEEAQEAAKKPEKWTLQLVSTSDPDEAERIAARAKAAGYTTITVKDRKAYKVRLAKPGPKVDMDAAETKLKAKGFRTFVVKTD